MAHGKALVRDALAGRPTSRAPFVPLVGAFAATCLQVPVREFYSSAAVLARGLDVARRLSNADGVVCLPDRTLVAEACGGALKWDADGPVLERHPATLRLDLEPEEVLRRGRMEVMLDAVQRLRHGIGQEWAVLSAVPGPYSLARELWGRDADLGSALVAGDASARELIDWATAVCVHLAHRLGALELDGCLVIDEMNTPSAGAAEAVAPIYQTIANVLAFYDCPAIYQADDVEWLLRQDPSCFEVVLPSRLTNDGPHAGPPRFGAALADDVIQGAPEGVFAEVRHLMTCQPAVLSTERPATRETPLPSLKMVSRALTVSP